MRYGEYTHKEFKNSCASATIVSVALACCLLAPRTFAREPDVGVFTRSLWLVQAVGDPKAASSSSDSRLKQRLAKALAKDAVITWEEVEGCMSRSTFDKYAGNDGIMTTRDISAGVEASMPATRSKLHSELTRHLDYLSTTFDLIYEGHRTAAERLGSWVAANYQEGKELHVIVVCTGNSRRSVLGSCMGNASAAYYGFRDLHFHSGGTEPTALNPRTATALRAVGFRIESLGKEAVRGISGVENPIYQVTWGEGLAMNEFSKHYADKENPQSGFAALMVCNEADSECPLVKGAALRLSMPYVDPKMYDDGAYELEKYAERRDDIGRTMLDALSQARRTLQSKSH